MPDFRLVSFEITFHTAHRIRILKCLKLKKRSSIDIFLLKLNKSHLNLHLTLSTHHWQRPTSTGGSATGNARGPARSTGSCRRCSSTCSHRRYARGWAKTSRSSSTARLARARRCCSASTGSSPGRQTRISSLRTLRREVGAMPSVIILRTMVISYRCDHYF